MRMIFIAGNWKMFKTKKEAREFAEEFKKLYHDTKVKAAICAPYTDLDTLTEAFRGTGIGVGAQNVHFESEGAFTGEISLAMLREIGVDYCIVGHSERRLYFGETDNTVNLKLKKLLSESLIRPILCVGESLEQRDEGRAKEVVSRQIRQAFAGIAPADAAKVMIAYEPIWAIGTGRTASPQQAEEMCALIRRTVNEINGEETGEETVILYGGSVKPENAGKLMGRPDIDGALVGGASLVPGKFMDIINFCHQNT